MARITASLRQRDALVEHRDGEADEDVERRLIGSERVGPGRHDRLDGLHRLAHLVELLDAERVASLLEELLFLFLDVVTDALDENGHLRPETVVLGSHLLELGEGLLDDVMLLEALEHLEGVLVAELGPNRGIEDLLLDLRVLGKVLDDLVADAAHLFEVGGLARLETMEQLLDVAMVLLQECEGVHTWCIPDLACRYAGMHGL